MGRLNNTLTPEDLKRGDLVGNGWFPVEFSNYEEKDNKKGDSFNLVCSFKILEGPSKDAVLLKFISEKFLAAGKSLYKVLGLVNPDGSVQLSTEAMLAKVGTKLKIYVKTSKNPDTGGEFNDITEFMPLG